MDKIEYQGVKNFTLVTNCISTHIVASQPTLSHLNPHCCISIYIVASQFTLLPLNRHCCLSIYIVDAKPTLLPHIPHCCLTTNSVVSQPNLLPFNIIDTAQPTLLSPNLYSCLLTNIVASQSTLLSLSLHYCFSAYSMTKYPIHTQSISKWPPKITSTPKLEFWDFLNFLMFVSIWHCVTLHQSHLA